MYISPKYSEPVRPVGTVAELFAGVGGFRIGLAAAGWKTIFSNQWEPSTKVQHASLVYEHQFGSIGHSNDDITLVMDRLQRNPSAVPDIDLLVGGFPCQDYSVAKTLSTSGGINGKKGVLWWQILRFIQMKKPPLLLLENVDRLLKSPASRRGRDFAVMLSSLCNEGYVVEWRVVTSSDYGFPQRRKRVFIVGRRENEVQIDSNDNARRYLTEVGVLARALPVTDSGSLMASFVLSSDLAEVTEKFDAPGGQSRFLSSGVAARHQVWTLKADAQAGEQGCLGSILQDSAEVDESFWVAPESRVRWEYLKGPKRERRIHASSGTEYMYSEGGMAFPDSLDNPSRTILTGEGGSSPSRFKHIIEPTPNRFRRLTPIELERLNGFPDNWTRDTAQGRVSDARRAFFMGNALVIGIVTMIGQVLADDYARSKKAAVKKAAVKKAAVKKAAVKKAAVKNY